MPAIDDRLSDGPGNPDDNALRGSAVAEAGAARFDSGSSVVAEPKMPGLEPRLVFIFFALPILKPVMPDLPPGLSEIFVPAAAALGDESSPGGGGGGGSGGGGGMGGNGGGMAGNRAAPTLVTTRDQETWATGGWISPIFGTGIVGEKTTCELTSRHSHRRPNPQERLSNPASQ